MDSLTFTIDSLLNVATVVNDTVAVSVSGTTPIAVVEMPQDVGPSPWLQLLLPVVITLLVVFIDKWVTRYYDHKDEKDSRKRYCDTIIGWIQKIEPIEKEFSKSVHQLSAEIAKSDDMQPVPYAMPLTLHDKLKDMTIEQMTEAFLRDFKDEKDKRYANMYNIISNAEFLTRIGESVVSSYESYNKQAFAYCKEWNKEYESFIAKYNTLPTDNPYSSIINEWMVELFKQPNSVKTHLQYLTKLDEVAYNNKDHETQAQTNRMLHIAKQSQALSEGYKVVFSSIADNIDFALKSLMSSASFFETNKD